MNKDLTDLRKQIDKIYQELVRLLAERFRVTQKVGEFKRDHGMPAVDPAREAIQFRHIADLARQEGLNPDYAQKILRLIIDEVVVNHESIQSVEHDE